MADHGMEDLFGSDSEEEQQQYNEQQVQESLEDDLGDEEAAPRGTGALFGSDDDDDDDDKGHGRRPRSPGSDSDREERRDQVPTGPPMEIEAPLLPLPPHDSLCLLRSTNIIGIQPRAFDPETYEVEEETYIDESGRERVRLANNAVIRWRMRRLPDGREVRESNARFVRWEDGSMQLLLGDEVLDVAEQDISHNNQYLFALRSVIQVRCAVLGAGAQSHSMQQAIPSLGLRAALFGQTPCLHATRHPCSHLADTHRARHN